MMDRIEILDSRKVLYSVLQAQYSYPLSRMKVEPFFKLQSENSRLEKELSSLRGVLAKVVDWDEFVERLNIEYTRLFEGPGHAPAPPYASFYMNDGRLMGQETLAVRRQYVQRGVASVHMGRIPDDHIALELAFMGFLSGEASDSLAGEEEERWKSLIEAQKSFLHDHLLAWVSRFCSDIRSATQEEFFTSLSKFTQAYLESDIELLGEMAASGSVPACPSSKQMSL